MQANYPHRLTKKVFEENVGLVMQDLWMLLFTAIFFSLGFSYIMVCRKLR